MKKNVASFIEKWFPILLFRKAKEKLFVVLIMLFTESLPGVSGTDCLVFVFRAGLTACFEPLLELKEEVSRIDELLDVHPMKLNAGTEAVRAMIGKLYHIIDIAQYNPHEQERKS